VELRGRNVADKLGGYTYDEKLYIMFHTNAHTLTQSGLNMSTVTPRKGVAGLVLASE